MQNPNEPYVGPRPFEENDRTLFFGRGQEANELISLITAHAAVLLYAQSGAGKTSLVRAGLCPLLASEENFDVLPPLRVRGQAALNDAALKIENIYTFNALIGATHSEDDQAKGGSRSQALARMSLNEFLQERKLATKASSRATIVVFDQFEELFTLYPEHWEERQSFFLQVRDALAASPLLRVLFSMREDFIAELDPYVHCLPEKLRTRFRIERLTRRTGLLAVTQPLETLSGTIGKRSFAPGVAEELIDNLLMIRVKTPEGVKKVKGKYVEPLQLQVVCQTLWNNLQPHDQLITRDHLKAFGDVDRALSIFYESAIQQTFCHTGIKAGVLRRWCEQKLITQAGTRGTVFRGEKDTAGLVNQAVDELERHSLIRMELRGGAEWYELTHDRFVEIIQESNQKWLLTRPAAEQILLRLEEKAREWDQNKQDGTLLDEIELREAERWLQDSNAAELEPSRSLIALVRESAKAITAKRQQEVEQQGRIQEQARMAKVFRWLSFALAVVLLVAVVAIIKVVKLQRGTEREKKNTQSALDKLKKEQAASAEKEETIKTTTGQNAAMLEAEKLLTADKLTEAAKAFEKLLKRLPEQDKTYIYLELADIELRTHDYDEAIRRYDDALRVWCQPVALEKNQCFAMAKNLPADKEPILKEYIAATLMKKGWTNLERGENEADQSQAAKRYNIARGYFQQAQILFNNKGEGFMEATSGLRKVSANEHLLDAQKPDSPD